MGLEVGLQTAFEVDAGEVVVVEVGPLATTTEIEAATGILNSGTVIDSERTEVGSATGTGTEGTRIGLGAHHPSEADARRHETSVSETEMALQERMQKGHDVILEMVHR